MKTNKHYIDANQDFYNIFFRLTAGFFVIFKDFFLKGQDELCYLMKFEAHTSSSHCGIYMEYGKLYSFVV